MNPVAQRLYLANPSYAWSETMADGVKEIQRLEREITRLRALVAAKNEALRVFASDKSWKFDRRPVYEEDHDDQWVWDDPWIDQGDKWSDGSVRTQPVTEPFKFAKVASQKE